jgi:Na+/H+ antiporter NhaD/arsenite permease-like protein
MQSIICAILSALFAASPIVCAIYPTIGSAIVSIVVLLAILGACLGNNNQTMKGEIP